VDEATELIKVVMLIFLHFCLSSSLCLIFLDLRISTYLLMSRNLLELECTFNGAMCPICAEWKCR